MDSSPQIPDWPGSLPCEDSGLGSQAVEETLLGIDVKRRRLLRVEGAEALVLPPRLLEGDVAGDQFDQVDALADLLARVGAVASPGGQWAAASFCFFASATMRSATWAGTSS